MNAKLHRCSLLLLIALLCCYHSLEGKSMKNRKLQTKCKKFNSLNGKLEMKFTLDVKCDDGYQQSPTETTKIMCINGGFKQVPNCIRACGDLDDPENGKVVVTSTLVDSVATYSCDKDFIMVGDKARICQHNGKWSGSKPQCQAPKCRGSDVPDKLDQVCCPSGCGSECGSPSCMNQPGGAVACCKLNILRKNVMCSGSSTAPCVLKPISPELQFILDEIDRLEQNNGKQVDNAALKAALDEISTLKKQLENTFNEVKAHRSVVVSERRLVEDLKRQVVTEREQVVFERKQVESLRASVEEKLQRVKDINRDIDGKVAEVNNCKIQIEQQKNDIDDTKMQIDGVKSDIDSVKIEIDNAHNEIIEARSKISANKNHLDEVANQISSSLTQIQTIASEIETKRVEINGIKSQINSVKQGIDAAKTEIETKQAEIENTQSTLENALKSPIPLRNPFLSVTYIIAIRGIFPTRNKRSLLDNDNLLHRSKRSISEPTLGQITMFGGNFAPRGFALCNGQLLTIVDNASLFSILGTTFGGDGRITFGLPDLRGRTPIHFGQGPGLSNFQLGEKGGKESHTVITEDT